MIEEDIEEDVPVYESIYPEHNETCSHPDCDGDVHPTQRVCEDCIPVMLSDTPDDCPTCGASIGTA